MTEVLPENQVIEIVEWEETVLEDVVKEEVEDEDSRPANGDDQATGDSQMILMTSNPNKCYVQCANCDTIFSQTDFESHLCDFDTEKKKIEVASPPPEPVDVEALPYLFLTNHPCFAQLEENCIKIRRFIKEELKITLRTSPNPMCSAKVRAAGLFIYCILIKCSLN